jgi:abortive infection bacteriophage resistance protein
MHSNNKVIFSKPPLCFIDQYNKLANIIDDNNNGDLLELLANSSYYHLKSYTKPLTKYFPGKIPVKYLSQLMAYDNKLRISIFSALHDIEIYFRAIISEFMCSETSTAFWYLDRNFFTNDDKHRKMLKKVEIFTNDSNEFFIKDFLQKYVSNASGVQLPPSWMLIEICTFGFFSKLYKNLQRKYRKCIATAFNFDENELASIMHSLNYIRNTCAHHARLWNRTLSITPKFPHVFKITNTFSNNKISAIIFIITYMSFFINKNINDEISQLHSLIINANRFYQKGMGFTSPVTPSNLTNFF